MDFQTDLEEQATTLLGGKKLEKGGALLFLRLLFERSGALNWF